METVQEDTWNGFGLLYALRVGIREGGGNILLLGIRAEEYHPTFGGEKAEIKNYTLSAECRMQNVLLI